MKTITEHIEYVKGQPHHIRKGVAFGTATISAGIIALAWLVSSLATGAFAVKGSSFADATGQGSVEVTNGGSGSQVAGAAAAPALNAANAPAHIEIVETSVSAKPTKKAEQTTIPF